jgi:hypothetical protein
VILSSILWAILETPNQTNLDIHITNQIYITGYHKDSKYGHLKECVLLLIPYKIIENIATGQNPIHLVSFITAKIFLGFLTSTSFFVLTSIIAIIRPITSNHNPTMKGRSKLILVKNGIATINNALKRDTEPRILPHILVKRFHILSSTKFSWTKADIVPDVNANPSDKNIDPIAK